MKLEKLFVIIILLFCIPLKGNSQGHGRGFIMQDSPFYDIFYTYYGESPDKAKKMLLGLMSDSKQKNQARINYGVIQQIEKRFDQAEQYYNQSMQAGDTLAFSYLYALHANKKNTKAMSLLRQKDAKNSNPWINYETCLQYLQANNTESALNALEQAVKSGYNFALIMDKEPLFDPVRNSRKYNYLYAQTKKNISPSSPAREIEELKFQEKKDRPYGLTKELQKISRIDRKEKHAEAAEALEGLLKTSMPIRDKSIALFWMARLKARQKDKTAAKKYLAEFAGQLVSQEEDATGFKKTAAALYKDIISNDSLLNKLLADTEPAKN